MSTFRQTLALFQQGRTDEVVAGCGLILQMDPMFEPARKLLEKARNPLSPIDVEQLLPADTGSKMDQARAAMAERDFLRVTQITSEILTEDLLNDEARVLGDEAREKIEAAPFVDQFTRRAEQALAGGNAAAAKMDLEKARALDPTHPEVVRIARQISAPPRPHTSPSFVVDNPAPSGRSTAQASDFGFTFEEEKPADVPIGSFSFDTPAPKPAEANFANFSFDAPSNDAPFSFGNTAPSGATEFDFATASVIATDDDQKKIEQFLADGDRAFAAGDYQQAIDLWSRIFLIDVTNDQASDRIERAKAKRRDIEQKVETVLASGIEAFERGDTAAAHADLTEVLRLDPNNSSAQEYLDRLGETVAESTPSYSSSMDDSFDAGFFEDELPPGAEPPLIPPDPNAAPAASTSKKKGKAKPAKPSAAPGPARKLPMPVILAVVAVLVLGAAGYFAWSKFSGEPEAAESGQTEAVLSRATGLANAGQYDKAIALLREIQPGDPLHDRALVMIADLQAKKSTSAQLIDGIPAAQYYEEKVAAARTAFEAHDYVAAKNAFEQAQRAKALPPDLKAMFDQATQQAAKLDAARALFGERRFSEAIANLQPLLEQDPQNQNIKRLIMDAHFNMGAMALQDEKTSEAMKQFDEVLKVDPNDELARRSRDLAMRYDNEPKDLLYRIYVKYLPLRKAA